MLPLSQVRPQDDPALIPPAGRPVARAFRVERAPVIDGNILGESVWEVAGSVSGFWQSAPDEGQPATQRTEVRIVYTEEALYFGVICYDREPSGIIVADSRRDSSLDETDSFQIILDAYLDRQSGLVFGTNPAGVEYDGQVSKEGREQGFDINWDGTWEVEAAISEIGWSAEFAIPFRTLRYRHHAKQIWGLNFQRNIRRRNETAYWSALPRQYNLHRLSLAGALTDLELPRQRNLKFIPYTLGEARHGAEKDSDTHLLGETGFDLKYGITPSLTLDLTYNTDFAQVEADEQQINLDRFSLFFPEKRPFFLENAGLFRVGEPQDVEIFFSRRIGLSPQGETIPILGGVRLSGRLGKTEIGFLNMQTEKEEGIAEESNYSVLRVSRELPHRSSVGAIFTNRQGTGDPPPGQEYNRAFALDGRAGIGRFGEVSGFAARTVTPGLDRDEYAFKVGSEYNSEDWLLRLNYTEVGGNFNPELGFLRRGDPDNEFRLHNGYRKPSALIWRRYRPDDFWGLQELRPHVSYQGFWDFDGFQESGRLHVDNHWEWKSGYEIHTGINFTREGVKEAFEIHPGVIVPSGTYDHNEVQIIGITNRGAPLSFGLRSFLGGFFGGDRVQLSPTLRLRVGERFNTEVGWTRNDIDLPGGSFVTNLGRVRISYSFTPRMFIEGLFQYNDTIDRWSTNLRYRWLQTANIGLFVVYNESRPIGSGEPENPDRSFTVKLSYQFELLE
ncbi:MAG: DUF5916 domain-containing protein [Acidobacteriota bacterium]